MEPEIPKFIKLRGCINCDISKQHKKNTGSDYGFDHELVAGCLLLGCINHGYGLYKPFLDPEEVLTKARETGNSQFIENAKRYLLAIEKRFGEFYRRMKIDLTSFLD